MAEPDGREGRTKAPEKMVLALEDAYLNTTDRFDALNEFRVALSAALAVAPASFLLRLALSEQELVLAHRLILAESHPDDTVAESAYRKLSAALAGEVEARMVAKLFHETYERLAPKFGYKTREASAVPWELVPESNRALMEATVYEVLVALDSHRASLEGDGHTSEEASDDR